ncbi:ATP-binding protein [Amylolactobacillus amylophilus]|uniref:ATP-binding protein n=1 Tax=Amylolactobacillus amylophilus TaxID=1603 RepID=UPI0006D2B9EF|nr:AAA family ATPase [Amylolactobacillus amylophilus]
MQISQIKVRNFGKFRDQVFDLTPGSTVFFGLNEAGKSTLVAFINQIMFGFARKSSKNFDYYQFETNPNVYGGQLTFRDDENEWVLERLQAKNAQAGNLRVFFNGTEVPSATFFLPNSPNRPAIFLVSPLSLISIH